MTLLEMISELKRLQGCLGCDVDVKAPRGGDIKILVDSSTRPLTLVVASEEEDGGNEQH